MYYKSKLTLSALSMFSIMSSGNDPIFSLSLFLSMVLICSNSTTEFLGSASPSAMTFRWVGSRALLSLDVIAATIIVGEYLFPILF